MTKFKCDENLPVEVTDLLQQAGHDALSVMDQQMAGDPDSDVAAVCLAEQRALVTLDLDFADIRSYRPEDYFGIIVLRPALQSIPAVVRLMARAVTLLKLEPLAGRLWIIEEHQVRIRGGNP